MKFEIVSKYTDAGLNLPERKTRASAGYDFEVAEDIVIPSYFKLMDKMMNATHENCHTAGTFTLKEMAQLTKDFRAKPTLVPTGIKCEMPEDMYLELSVRSSCPLKHWLILANGVGIIDADYYNNPDNEGHIFFQIINLSPFDIVLHKGDAIGQGIFHKYYTVDNDAAEGERTGGFGSTSELRDYVGKRLLTNPIDDYGGIIDVKDSLIDEERRVYLLGQQNCSKDTGVAIAEEECVMACNPERRAYIFGVDLSSADERIERSYEQYPGT